jgi:hypothetical protein
VHWLRHFACPSRHLTCRRNVCQRHSQRPCARLILVDAASTQLTRYTDDASWLCCGGGDATVSIRRSRACISPQHHHDAMHQSWESKTQSPSHSIDCASKCQTLLARQSRHCRQIPSPIREPPSTYHIPKPRAFSSHKHRNRPAQQCPGTLKQADEVLGPGLATTLDPPTLAVSASCGWRRPSWHPARRGYLGAYLPALPVQ